MVLDLQWIVDHDKWQSSCMIWKKESVWTLIPD